MTSGTHILEVTAPGFVRTVVEGLFFNALNTGDITVALDAGSADERVVLSLAR